MTESSPKMVENALGKGEMARYEQFLLLPLFSKEQSLFGKGLTLYQKSVF